MKTTKPFLGGSIALLLLLTSIFIYSCRKDILPNGTTPSANVDVAKLKTWYQGKYPVSGKQTNTTTPGGRDDISQIIQPDWDAAYVYNRDGNDVIELPAESGDYLIGLKSPAGEVYNPKFSHSSFLLLKNGEQIEAYVMTVVADSAYINNDLSKLQQNKYSKRDTSFSGVLIYSTPKGDFVSGWIYQDGKLLRKMTPQNKAQTNVAGRKKVVQDVKNNLSEVCTTYQLYDVWCEWGGTADDPYRTFKGCNEYYTGSVTECVTSGGSGGGGSGGGGGTGSGGAGSTTPVQSPCTPTPAAITKGGLKVNIYEYIDDKFPSPTDPGPCNTPTDGGRINFGLDKDCMNCRVPSTNFMDFIKFLQNEGYKVKLPYHEKNFQVNDVYQDGMVTEIYDADGKYVLCYFTPDESSSLLQTGIQYAVGYGTYNGGNNGDNFSQGLPAIPNFSTSQAMPHVPNTEWPIAFLPIGDVSGPVATTAPGNNEVYTDPATGTTLKYADVENGFKNSSALAQIEAGEEVTTWPSISVIIGPIGKGPAFYLEYEILKLNNPAWPSYKLASVAFWNIFRNDVHFLLDVGGMVPVYGEAVDLFNGGIYFLEGDKINCALSTAAAIPVAGWVATGGKWVKRAVYAVPIANSIGKNAYRAIKIGKEARLIKVAVTAFNHASLKTLKAIKPADATLTNLNAYLINTFGLRISPTSTTLKNAINDIIKYGDQAGTKMEKLADDIFATNGYQKFNSKIGSNNGFDAVYIKGDLSNPTEIIINEAKQMSNVGTVKLNKASEGKAAQMSKTWINQTIQQMRINSDPAIANLGNILFNNSTKIVKTVSAVDKGTGEIVILKLLDY